MKAPFSVPLPYMAWRDSLSASLTDDDTESAATLAISFADRGTWRDRAALVDRWIDSITKKHGLGELAAIIPTLTAILEPLRDDAITNADQAGLYLVSYHEPWRAAAWTWFDENGGMNMATFLSTRPGLVSLLSVYHAAHNGVQSYPQPSATMH